MRGGEFLTAACVVMAGIIDQCCYLSIYLAAKLPKICHAEEPVIAAQYRNGKVRRNN